MKIMTERMKKIIAIIRYNLNLLLFVIVMFLVMILYEFDYLSVFIFTRTYIIQTVARARQITPIISSFVKELLSIHLSKLSRPTKRPNIPTERFVQNCLIGCAMILHSLINIFFYFDVFLVFMPHNDTAIMSAVFNASHFQVKTKVIIKS